MTLIEIADQIRQNEINLGEFNQSVVLNLLDEIITRQARKESVIERVYRLQYLLANFANDCNTSLIKELKKRLDPIGPVNGDTLLGLIPIFKLQPEFAIVLGRWVFDVRDIAKLSIRHLQDNPHSPLCNPCTEVPFTHEEIMEITACADRHHLPLTNALEEAKEILIEANLGTEANFQIIAEHSQHFMLEPLSSLYEANLLNQANFELLSNAVNQNNSLVLAIALDSLCDAEILNQENFSSLLNFTMSTEVGNIGLYFDNSGIYLDYLLLCHEFRTLGLLNQGNFTALSNLAHDRHFDYKLRSVKFLSQTHILNQTNFDILLHNQQHYMDIHDCLSGLYRNSLLNQTNFDSVVNNRTHISPIATFCYRSGNLTQTEFDNFIRQFSQSASVSTSVNEGTAAEPRVKRARR